MNRPAIDKLKSAARSSSRDGSRGFVRSLGDGLVCLAVAVILFRTFKVEGYMISTGSMAPFLRGYHKCVVCPSCQFSFAYGVDAENDNPSPSHIESSSTGDSSETTQEIAKTARCPNCGQNSIDIKNIPRNHGDQLLVHKNAYLLRDANRWEVVVFRNPTH